MSGGVDWLSAVGILLCGLIVGVMFVYRIMTTRRQEATAGADLERRDLTAKVEDLVARLRETGNDQPEERQRLEQEAASALRSLAGINGGVLPDSPPTAAVAGEVPAKRGGALAGFLWGAGSMAALALLGYFVWSSSTPRSEGAPVTGNAEPPMAAASAAKSANDPDVQRLKQELQAAPDDINRRLELAKRELMLEDFIGVSQETGEILKRDPENAQALTYAAFVRMTMGQNDQALEMLNRALAKDPSLIDGWVQLALVDTRMGRDADAERAIASAVRLRPDQEAALRGLLAQMRAPANAPQESSAPPAAAGNADPSTSVGGTIVVPPAASPSAVLFVLARPVGVTSGPPVAVARLEASGASVPFELSAANSMMGQALPNRLRLEARLDMDGNAMTHQPEDLNAVIESAALGSHDLVLKLAKQN